MKRAICYLVIKGIILSLYKRTTYRICCMSCDRKYMFAGLFKSTDTQAGVLKSSDSGTNFLVPKVNLAPQDSFLEIYC